MSFQKALISFGLAASFCQSTLAAAVPDTDTAYASPATSMKTMADRYNRTTEGMVAYQDRMIAQGKMYRPDRTESGVVEVRATAASFELKNIACGIIVGDPNEYQKSSDFFCTTAKSVSSATLVEVYLILLDGICDGNPDCTGIFSIGTITAGAFAAGIIDEYCPAVFAELSDSCNGNVGGTAEVTFTDVDGKEIQGTIEADYYAQDDSATCPANDDAHVCKKQNFP